MTSQPQSANDEIELDDIDAYIATLGETELRELDFAGAALDLAIFLYRVRERKGLSQSAAARLAGLQQQAVSRLEHGDGSPRLETIQKYLDALGYSLELRAVDPRTGESLVAIPFVSDERNSSKRAAAARAVVSA